MHELSRLLLASVFTLTVGTLASSARADQQKVGVAGAVNPATNATPEGGNTAILNIGNDVSFHELIKTDTDGQAQLLFLDRSALTVGPNASLTIDEFVYNPDTKEGKLAINAAVGVFRFVGGQLSKSGDVTLKTPVATIGIRGGVATVDVKPGGAFTLHMMFGAQATVVPNLFVPQGGPGGPPGGGVPGAPTGGGTAAPPIIVTPGNTLSMNNTGQFNIVPTTTIAISTTIKSFEPTQSSSGNQQLNVNSTTVNQTIQNQANSGTGFTTPSQVITTPGAIVTTVAAVATSPQTTTTTSPPAVIPVIPTIVTKPVVQTQASVATVASPPPPPPPPPPVVVSPPPPPPPVVVSPPPPPASPPVVTSPPPVVVSPPSQSPPSPPVPQSPPHPLLPPVPTPPNRPN
jgi:hypothetical protein